MIHRTKNRQSVELLNAIALSDEFKDGTLRFSFSIENTKEEVDETIKALKELVPMLRRFVRK